MEIKEGYMPFMGHSTYYRIVNPDGRKTPLILLHGGPGSTHNSYELLDELAFKDDRPFLMYDQIGCGLSYVEEGHQELYNKETWVRELMELRKYLGYDEVHLLGHSWGGMLEIIYLCDYHPKGVKSAVFSSTLASASLWERETHRLILQLPKEEVEVIREGEKNKDFDSPSFQAAMEDYMHHFVSGPWGSGDPECLTRKKVFGREAYMTAWGPCEFKPLGNLKDYEYLDKLSEIHVPVLLIHGKYDESTLYQNKKMYDALTCKKKWVTMPHSRHMSLYEDKKAYAEELLRFLNETD